MQAVWLSVRSSSRYPACWCQPHSVFPGRSIKRDAACLDPMQFPEISLQFFHPPRSSCRATCRVHHVSAHTNLIHAPDQPPPVWAKTKATTPGARHSGQPSLPKKFVSKSFGPQPTAQDFADRYSHPSYTNDRLREKQAKAREEAVRGGSAAGTFTAKQVATSGVHAGVATLLDNVMASGTHAELASLVDKGNDSVGLAGFAGNVKRVDRNVSRAAGIEAVLQHRRVQGRNPSRTGVPALKGVSDSFITHRGTNAVAKFLEDFVRCFPPLC